MRVVGLVLCLVLASGQGALHFKSGAVHFKSGVHSDLCAWGSQYWCSSTKTAERCGKTEFCATKVWPLTLIQDNQCQVTQQMVKYVRQLLDSRVYKMNSYHDMAMVIAKACSNFEDDKNRLQCKAVVTDNDILPKLMKLIASRLPTESVALAVGGCHRQESLVKCHRCEEFTKSIQHYVSKSLSKDAYLQLFRPVCDKAGHGSKTCMHAISTRYQAFRHGLTKAQPKQVCAGKSICLKKNIFSDTEKFDSCSACKDVVQTLRDLDRNQEVQSIVHDLLKSACTFMGGFQELCDLLADEGLTYVFEIIASELEPIVVCEKLELCGGQEQNLISAPERTKKEGSLDCLICQSLVTEIETFITSKSAFEEIEKVLKRFCSKQPSSLYEECSNFIDQFGPLIIRLVVNSVPPKKVCEFISVCKDKVEHKNNPQETPGCALCEFVLKELDTLVGSNKTEQAVVQALDTVCKKLPATITSVCEDLVKSYSPEIISLIVSELDPKLVCTRLGICKNNTVLMTKFKSKHFTVKDEKCVLCEFVMSELDNILKENNTEVEIEAAVKQVCQILPSTISQECSDFVNKYTPILIQLLLQFEPKQICQMLGLCNSTTSKLKVEHKVTPKETPSCALCEFVLKELDTSIGSNKTEQAVVQALDTVCKKLPATITSACEDLVKSYSPEIISLIVSELDPKLVCTKLGICKNNTVLMTKLKSKHSTVKDEKCELCEFIMSELDNILKENNTKEEIEAALQQVCQILPSTIKQECSDFVKTYTPVLVQLLLQFKPEQMCQMLGLCNSTSPKLKVEHKVAPKETPGCALCEFVLKELDTSIGSNKTEQAVVQALDTVCKKLPATITSACEDLVKSYSPEIISLIVSELDPKLVCTKLGICKNNTVLMTKLKSKHSTLKDEKCELCEFIMNELDNILKENNTKEEIEAALQQVCQILPSTIKQECSDFVKTYTPVLVQLLLQFKPEQMCQMLGLCNSTSPKLNVEHKVAPKETPSCALCEFVLKELDTSIGSNKTEQAVVQALDTVCKKLPATITSACEDLVKSYSPEIISLIVSELDPKLVCTKLGICKNNTVLMTKLKSKHSTLKDEKCELCEFIMSELDNILKENNTKEEIEAALQQVCQILPSTIKQECSDFVKTYTPVLVQLLLQFKPEQMCLMLGLCNSTSPKLKVEHKVAPKETPSCALCEFVLKELDTSIGSNKTEQAVVQALDTVCKKLPATITSACEDLVKSYSPEIISLIVSELDPKLVCTKLGICKNNTVLMTKLKSKHSTLKDEKCELCEFIMSELDNILKENNTKEEIEAALQQVCQILPSTIKQECSDFVKTYTPVLVQLLLQFKPEQMCQMLGLCNSTSPKLKVEHKVAPKETPGCALCEFVLKELDTSIGSNKTEQAVEQALDSVCKKLPATITSACEDLVKSYSPEIISLIVRELDPKLVCTKLGICKNNTVLMTKLKSKHSTVKDEKCELCEFIMSELDNILKENNTKEEIEAALQQVCQILPSTIKQECSDFVKTYTPVLVQLLLQFKPEQMCQMLGLCNSTSPKIKVEHKVAPKETPGCALCEFVLKELDTSIGSNKTEQAVVQALDTVCKKLPATITSACEDLVKSYSPEIISLIVSELDPKLVCTKLGICKNNTVLMTKFMSKQSTIRDQLCPLCEFIMTELDNILEDNSTVEQIEKALEEVCQFLPSSIRKECSTLVNTYTPMLIQLLLAYKPDQVCQVLGLCNSTSPKLKVISTPSVGKQKTEICALCITLMQFAEKYLDQNSTENEIVAVLDKVCNILPESDKQPCSQIMKMLENYVVQMIEQQVSPEEICKAIKLCSHDMVKNSKPLKKLSVGPAVRQGEQCIICKFVMQELDSLLETNATKEDITAAIEEVCDLLPTAIKEQCLPFVKLYAPYVVNLLVQHLVPSEICGELGLCNSTAKNPFKTPSTSVKVKTNEFCSVCIDVLTVLDNFLEKNSTEKAVIAAIDKVCDVLPDQIKDKCLQLVALYAPYAVDLVVEALSPHQICDQLRICTDKDLTANDLKSYGSVKDSQLCDFCEEVFTTLVATLKDNATQAQIESALDRVCDIIPSAMKQECIQLIKAFTPQIIQMLVQRIQPKQLCVNLGLCTNIAGKVQQFKMPKATSGELCTLCEFVLNYVDQILKDNSTQQEIKQVLEEVCNVLPSSLTAQCTALIDQYFTLVIQVFEELSPQEICISLGLCQSKGKFQQLKMPKATSGELCTLCEVVLNYVDQALKDNATQQEIKQVLEEICNILPSSLTSQCTALIDQYFTLVIQVFEELSPQEICTSLGLCESKAVKELTKVKGVECALCEYIMSKLESMITSNSSEGKIAAALETVCSLLPSTLKKDCDSFIEKYSQLILQLLLQEIRPRQVCIALGVCSSESIYGNARLVHAPSRKNNVKSNELCTICESVMTELDNILSSPATEAQVKDAFEKVCSLLPENIQEECKNIIGTYADYILDLIIQEVSPKMVCTLLKLCKNTGREELGKDINFPKAGPLCPLCEYVIDSLDKILEENSTEAQIEAALDKVCNILPSTISDDCIKFVELYAPQVIDALVKDFSAKVVCTYIGLCTNTTMTQANLVKPEATSTSSPTCFLCEMVIGKLKSMIQSKATEAEIKAPLEKVCGYLPDEFKEDCDKFVEEYTSEIIKLILAGLSTEEICYKLGFCSSSKDKITLKSVEGCTLCKFVLEELQGVLWSPVNEEEATDALKNICNELPNNLQTACRDLVIMVTPNLMDFIGHRIYPKGICEFLELCVKNPSSNSLMVSKQKSFAPQPVPPSVKNCTACKFTMYEIQTALNTPYWQAETKTILLLFCQKVKTWPDVCQYLVNQNLPGLISLIRGFRFPIEFCQELNMCEPKKNEKHSTSLTFVPEQRQVMTPPSPHFLKTCTSCKFAWYTSQLALKTPFWNEETQTVLLHLCQKVQTRPDLCQSIVTQNLPAIIDEIQGFNFPIEFCQELNVCEAPLKESSKSATNDVECEMCRVLAEIAGSFLQKNSTVMEGEALLIKVCNTVIPEGERSQCISVVQEYTPVLLQLVSQFMDPKKVCETIKLCPKVPGYDVRKRLRHGGY